MSGDDGQDTVPEDTDRPQILTRDNCYYSDASRFDRKSVMFRCPCRKRWVVIQSPPHTISFDSEGLLTVNRSCGLRAGALVFGEERPANWCHFWVRDGKLQLCNDARCPGADDPAVTREPA